MCVPIHLPGFEIEAQEEQKQEIIIQAHSTSQQGVCPNCQTISSHLHSHHQRSPRDLPISEHRVQLVLTLKRYRCLNPACPKKTFVESHPEFLPKYARRTDRLTHSLQAIAFACGGEAGAQLAGHLCMRISADTLIRLIRHYSFAETASPRVLGVDDFALRRGHRYGTILVDLEKHCPVDLFEGRSAEGLARWLQDHPGSEWIPRDRSTEYSRGIAESGSKAQQIVDRWHLLRNLREVLERMLSRLFAQLKELPITPAMQSLAVPILPKRKKTTGELAQQEAHRVERLARYQAVQDLVAEGVSLREIALRLGIHRVTVQRFAQASAFPERAAHQSQSSILVPFLPYLQKRFSEGCTSSQQLWREIHEQGFPGTSKQVIRWVQQAKAGGPLRPPSLLPPKQLVWVFLKDREQLDNTEQAILEFVCQDPVVPQAYTLSQSFRRMVRERQAEKLQEWLTTAEVSTITELNHFARGMRQDNSAIFSALKENWSNGQTEGQNTRLKLLKRQMYGRAKLDLLRQRVLYRDQ